VLTAHSVQQFEALLPDLWQEMDPVQCLVSGHEGVRFNRSDIAMRSEGGTCLVYHIDEGLRIIPAEAVDRVTLVLTRGDCLDQGGEFM
jgi:hypothetical protein